jgi:hypothetical protein
MPLQRPSADPARPRPGTTPERKNLVLMTHPGRQDPRDFEAIAAEIARLAPEITVHIVRPFDTAALIEDWNLRSLIVSLADLRHFQPPRGRLFQAAFIPKYEEYLAFAAAGVPTPLTSVFRMGRPFDYARHKSLVVAKPTKMGSMSHGDQVVLMRRERVEQVVPARFPPGLTSDEAPVIVQDFIDTGTIPEHFRVLVLFGEPLFCYRTTSKIERSPLDAPDADLESSRVANNAPGRMIEFVADAEAIEFAKRASRATWWLPLHALDLVREKRTGALYVLESNPGGNTWVFSSQMGKETRSLVGGAEPFKKQFGAWNIAAKALIGATHSFAE